MRQAAAVDHRRPVEVADHILLPEAVVDHTQLVEAADHMHPVEVADHNLTGSEHCVAMERHTDSAVRLAHLPGQLHSLALQAYCCCSSQDLPYHSLTDQQAAALGTADFQALAVHSSAVRKSFGRAVAVVAVAAGEERLLHLRRAFQKLVSLMRVPY